MVFYLMISTNKLVGHAEWVKVDESEYEGDYSNDYQENQQKVDIVARRAKDCSACWGSNCGWLPCMF